VTPTMYHIGKLAAESGLTPDTLRYYERVGLLPRPRRSSGGYRLYAPATLVRLQFIRQARALGLTLREIRELVGFQERGGLERCRRVHDLVQVKLQELDARLAQLREFRETLSRYLEACERTLAARRDAECPVIETMERRSR